MLQFAATKSVNLECEFEEFTTNIPLYRVIISALHLVKNTPHSKLTQTWNLQRTLTLFVPLSSHPSTPSKNRIERCTHNPTQSTWAQTLERTTGVSRGSFGAEKRDSRREPTRKGYAWHINTATDIWEHLLHNSARYVLTRHSVDAFAYRRRNNVCIPTWTSPIRGMALSPSETPPEHRQTCLCLMDENWSVGMRNTNKQAHPQEPTNTKSSLIHTLLSEPNRSAAAHQTGCIGLSRHKFFNISWLCTGSNPRRKFWTLRIWSGRTSSWCAIEHTQNAIPDANWSWKWWTVEFVPQQPQCTNGPGSFWWK